MKNCFADSRAPSIVAGLWLLAVTAAAMPPGDAGAAVREARAAIGELRLEHAAGLLRGLSSEHQNDPDVYYVRALLAFHEGDYAGAQRSLESSLAAEPRVDAEDDRKTLLDLITDTRAAIDNFRESRSSDGRFVVSHAPGRDEVLVPYALEALQAADRALTEELGLRVPGPVRLEIYPTAASLAQVSTLSVEAIQRTGTIALCKWNRLMITSPRALVRGYPWMDTIAHEYVHLVLSRASRDKAPVWFQEGVAKFLERRWRGDPPGADLDPASEALLARAVRDKELLPFEQLHPSIALLPSQEAAALAFAQVATFFDRYYATYGRQVLQEAIARIAVGEDARQALAEVAGRPWAELEARWKAHLARRDPPARDPPRLLSRRLRHGEEVDDTLDVEQEQARRYLRLGDLLWDRGRPGAAKVEYGKASDAAPDDPIVASRLARAALTSGDAARAVAAIDPIVARYPEHAPARSVLSAAHLARDELQEARRQAREAIRLNPFDPEPHCVLAMAGSDEESRRRERAACQALGGSSAAE